MRHYLYLYFLVCLLLTSCSKKTAPTVKEYTKDSTHVSVSEILRDTAITVPADSVEVKLPLSAMVSDVFKPHLNIVKKSKQATVKVNLSDDTLTVSANCDSMVIELKLKDKVISEYELKLKEKTTVVPERYVPLLVKILAALGCAFIIYIIIKIKL